MLTEGEMRKIKRLQKRYYCHITGQWDRTTREPLSPEEDDAIDRELQALCLRRAHDHMCVLASEPLRPSQLTHGGMLRDHRAGHPILRWWDAFAGAIGEATDAADRDLDERLMSLGLITDRDEGGLVLEVSVYAGDLIGARGRYVYHAATDVLEHASGVTVQHIYPHLLLEPLHALAETLPPLDDLQAISQADNARAMAAYELCLAYGLEWIRSSRTGPVLVRPRQEYPSHP